MTYGVGTSAFTVLIDTLRRIGVKLPKHVRFG